jgi:predicted RNA-binding Zn-ribbon protein involved in translation (DUF1610 family)
VTNNEPMSVSSGLPLRQELKEAGFLEQEDAQNYLLHYGTTSDTHIMRGMYGDFEIHHCEAPHGQPTECDRCEWSGPMPSNNPRGGSHDCPKCGNDLF